MRMQQTGKSGTSGQVKPEEKLRNHLINLCVVDPLMDIQFALIQSKHDLLTDIAMHKLQINSMENKAFVPHLKGLKQGPSSTKATSQKRSCTL